MSGLAQFTEYQLTDFKDVYDLYCARWEQGVVHDHLNREWAKKYLRSCGADPTPEEMTKIVSKHEKWTFKDLVDELRVLLKDAENEEEIIKAFKVFDYNYDGFVEEMHIRFAMTEIGEKMDEEEFQVFMKYVRRHCEMNARGAFKYMDMVKLMFSDPVQYVHDVRDAHLAKLEMEKNEKGKEVVE